MAKPVILAVDDDPQVLRAVERDLRRKYAREYRVLRADSGESALDALREIRQASTRISELVGAVKSYSHMDKASQKEADVHEGLEKTLVMLSHKLKKGNVEVVREYAEDLPRVCAHGSELNQVWTNLVDNAIDAVGGDGHIKIRTARENDRVLVEIADDGPGISEEIQDRIFEPFFTTKDVGKGTGLGLDVCYRIVVGRHGGDLRVVSRPGDTRFQVRLPTDAPDGRPAVEVSPGGSSL